MSRKRHPTLRTGMELPMPQTAHDAPPVLNPDPTATTVSSGGPVVATPAEHAFVGFYPASQLDKANALARAREDGEREGTIAAMCGCIAQAEELSDCFDAERGIVYALRLELHRRFGRDDPRVVYHLKLRGLQP